MTPHHHPSDELLLDYASGAQHEAWALCVASHLALCPECRVRVRELEGFGGGFLADSEPVPVDEHALDNVLARLDAATPETVSDSSSTAARLSTSPVLPEPLRSYVGGDSENLEWRRLGRGAYQFVIPLSATDGTARILRIPAGKPVPEHTHRGLELTLVLQGAFGDQTGHYGRGDLEVADEQLTHQPLAAPGDDCICLAVTDAPLRFKGIAARMVQPFLGI
jgi:putative transcriptional regulator